MAESKANDPYLESEVRAFVRLGRMALLFAILTLANPVSAKVTGDCSNCHTMHNSQNDASMQFDSGTALQPNLLRSDCLGCHGQGGRVKILEVNGSQIPQVMHADGSGDLAAGNFAYITGMKGDASESHGHNVVDLGEAFREQTLSHVLPGGIRKAFHEDYIVNASNLTCAGANGCHGYRNYLGPSGVPAMSGAHHGNVDGRLDVADRVENSYRFLVGVKGYENQVDRWQNVNAESHNEYYAATTPMTLEHCTTCHNGPRGSIAPESQTISGFCATCHGNFHTLSTGASDGIGSDIGSAFIRHPSDIVLPNRGEYQHYTSYSVEAPVGRTTIPNSPSSIVTPGADVVTCLSCHMAHASPYPDMLRWDYNSMNAHSSGDVNTGCFTCHTSKDD